MIELRFFSVSLLYVNFLKLKCKVIELHKIIYVSIFLPNSAALLGVYPFHMSRHQQAIDVDGHHTNFEIVIL